MPQTSDQLPLEGVRIIDFSRYAAGPHASVTLAHCGADVVTISNPDGRPVDQSLDGAFAPNLLSNKRSLTLDLKADKAKDIVFDLVESADVVMHNFRPGVMEGLGFDYDSITEINEDIVYCSVTGFGESGEYTARPSFDPIGQAMSGLMWVTGESDRKPSRIGASVIDYSTATYAALAIMIALWHREHTGTGQKVEASLFETAATFMNYWYTYYSKTGKTIQRQGHTWDMYAPVGVFETATDPIYMAIFGERMWRRFCKALDREDWLEDERYADEEARLSNRDELMGEIETIFQDYTREEMLETLLDNDLPVSELFDVTEAAENEHLRARGTVQTVEDIDGIEVLAGAAPISFSETDPRPPRTPPENGADTESVLRELGYSTPEIEALRTNDVV